MKEKSVHENDGNNIEMSARLNERNNVITSPSVSVKEIISTSVSSSLETRSRNELLEEKRNTPTDFSKSVQKIDKIGIIASTIPSANTLTLQQVIRQVCTKVCIN